LEERLITSASKQVRKLVEGGQKGKTQLCKVPLRRTISRSGREAVGENNKGAREGAFQGRFLWEWGTVQEKLWSALRRKLFFFLGGRSEVEPDVDLGKGKGSELDDDVFRFRMPTFISRKGL